MSQFAQSRSAMDDAIGEDGDRGFVSVNQRLQLNQLQPGEVRESLNGRMEGFWRPRKGIVEKTSAFTTGGTPLQLPFFLMAVERNISVNPTISGTTVTVQTSVNHGFSTGDLVAIKGINFTSGTNPNGVFQVTVTASNQFTYQLVGGIGPYTRSTARATDLSKTISAVSYSSDLVTLTVTGHGFTIGDTANGSISDVTFTGTDYNGVRLLTVVDANTLTFPVSGVTGVAIGTYPRISQLIVNDAANANVRASCLFSDPNTGNKEYVIIALDTVAKKIDLADYSVTNIPYPPGQALGADTDMIQVFDKVMLFRDGQQAFEWFPNGRPVLSASQSGTTTVTMSVKDHGLFAGAQITVDGLTGGTPANGTFTVVSVTDQDTFTYTFTTSQTQTFDVSGATVTDGFTLSPGGTYTQPQTFNIQAKDVDVVSGLVTATVTGNVTIRAGDVIVVRECVTPELSGMVGNEYYVTSATTTEIKWYAPVGDYSGSDTDAFEFGGRFSVGGGFMHQPGAPWGVYFQRRLWVPHYYNQSGPYNAPVYTSTKITDEIAVSDILDTTTFDQIENQFRISGGTADYVVGMHGFYDDALIVLNRNSLHLISGTVGSLLDTKVTELTSEVGCLARRTVVSRGNLIMFLSDDGVYAVEFLNDYNLRGAEEPISKSIQPYIDRINKDYADRAVGVLFDNRYYLAVPLDSVAGANDARGNNAILVFNFLNKGWESLDTFGDSRFLIDNFVIGSAGVRDNIYAVTANGGLHQLEAADTSIDRLSVSNTANLVVTPTINASLTTRGYDLGTMERKRFTDAQVVMQNLAGEQGEYSISFAAEDPDSAQLIGTTTQFLGGEILAPSSAGEAETAGIRCRLGGIRGYTGTMILTRTIGSPKVNSIKVAGSVTNRQIISQK
jgi:hypothetical protein